MKAKKRRNRRDKIFPWRNKKLKLSPLMHFLKNTPTVFFVRLSFLHMKNLKVVPIPLLQLVYLAGQNNLKQS